jgi:replicative DNA helicase
MKELPNSMESEQALIGSVLLDRTRLDYIDVKSEDFYDGKHKVLWTAILNHNADNQSWDMITLREYLQSIDSLQSIGGDNYLLKLQGSTVVPSHSQHYAKVLKEKSKLRKEIKILEEATRIAYEGESPQDMVIGQLMEKDTIETKSVDAIINHWDNAREGIKNTIPTPYPDLDRRTGGIRKGMVTVFTGRSKSGKSMFLSHWYNYLGQQNIPTLVIPLEDKYDITIKRMSANFGNYCYNTLDAGGRYYIDNGKPTWTESTDREIQKGKDCLKVVSEYPIHFFDKKVTPTELKSIASKYKRKYDIQVMFVDGAKDLKRPSGKYNDTGFDEEISQKMCEIAETLDIAIISIHHLTKLPDYEMITNNHIRGSGNIVGDSRSVYALQSLGIENLLTSIGHHCDYDEEQNLTTRIFHCISNNHGTTGMKVLDTKLSHCQFIEKNK